MPPNEEYSKIEVLDAAGRVVYCENIANKAETLMIPTDKFAQGTYIIMLTPQTGTMSRKMQVR